MAVFRLLMSVVFCVTRPSRLLIDVVLPAISVVFCVTRPSRLLIDVVLPAMSAVFCATCVLTAPSAASTLLKPLATVVAAPEVPAMLLAFASAKLGPEMAPVVLS
ncbi:hypothetical protein AWB71_04199 [Caballeronia peredens]|nr:hypothetical protein AWB71_04199 [Caballeronia peredens]